MGQLLDRALVAMGNYGNTQGQAEVLAKEFIDGTQGMDAVVKQQALDQSLNQMRQLYGTEVADTAYKLASPTPQERGFTGAASDFYNYGASMIDNMQAPFIAATYGPDSQRMAANNAEIARNNADLSEAQRLDDYKAAQNMAQAKARGEYGVSAYLQNFDASPFKATTELASSVLPAAGALLANAGAVALDSTGVLAPIGAAIHAATPAALAAIGAAQSYGGARADLYEKTMAASDADLIANSPQYAQLRNSGMTEQQAKNQIGTNISDHIPEFIGQTLTGALTGGIEGKLMRGLGGGVLSSVLKGQATEGLDEGMQQVLSNYAYQKVDQRQALLEDVPLSALQGAMLGSAMGGVGGAVNYYNVKNAPQSQVDAALNVQGTAEQQQLGLPGPSVPLQLGYDNPAAGYNTYARNDTPIEMQDLRGQTAIEMGYNPTSYPSKNIYDANTRTGSRDGTILDMQSNEVPVQNTVSNEVIQRIQEAASQAPLTAQQRIENAVSSYTNTSPIDTATAYSPRITAQPDYQSAATVSSPAYDYDAEIAKIDNEIKNISNPTANLVGKIKALGRIKVSERWDLLGTRGQEAAKLYPALFSKDGQSLHDYLDSGALNDVLPYDLQVNPTDGVPMDTQPAFEYIAEKLKSGDASVNMDLEAQAELGNLQRTLDSMIEARNNDVRYVNQQFANNAQNTNNDYAALQSVLPQRDFIPIASQATYSGWNVDAATERLNEVKNLPLSKKQQNALKILTPKYLTELKDVEGIISKWKEQNGRTTARSNDNTIITGLDRSRPKQSNNSGYVDSTSGENEPATGNADTGSVGQPVNGVQFSQSNNNPFGGREVDKTPLGDTKTVTVDGKEYSVFNSNGNPIHPTVEGVRNFVRWFGDSKITHNGKTMAQGGKPLVVYHGSGNEFNQFKYDYLGNNGTAEGYGFYFTDKKDIANGYSEGGKLFEVYLNISNPFSYSKKTITKNQYKEIVRKIDKDGSGYLSNFGDVEYDGYNSVLKEAVDNSYDYSENDIDLIGDFVGSGENVESVYDAIFEVTKKSGGIVTNPTWGNGQTIFLATNANQIKSATENTGAFDGANNDIRFSDTENKQPKTGNTVSQIKTKLADAIGLQGKLFRERLPMVDVVQSVTDELRAQVGDGQLSQLSGAQGFYNPKTKRITLIADNIPVGKELSVFLHEVFHKRGDELLGDKMPQLVSRVTKWKDADVNSIENQIYVVADARAKSSGNYDGEFLAYAIEEAVNRGVKIDPNKIADNSAGGFLAYVYRVFTTAFKKLVPNYKGKFTADDLVSIAYGAAQMELNPSVFNTRRVTGELYGTAENEPNNSVIQKKINADIKNKIAQIDKGLKESQAFINSLTPAQKKNFARIDNYSKNATKYKDAVRDIAYGRENAIRSASYYIYNDAYFDNKNYFDKKISDTDPSGQKTLNKIYDENKDLIDRIHENRWLVFTELNGNVISKANKVLHRSGDDYKNIGSNYYLALVDGKPAYIRVSDHFGGFTSKGEEHYWALVDNNGIESPLFDTSAYENGYRKQGMRAAGFVHLDEFENQIKEENQRKIVNQYYLNSDDKYMPDDMKRRNLSLDNYEKLKGNDNAIQKQSTSESKEVTSQSQKDQDAEIVAQYAAEDGAPTEAQIREARQQIRDVEAKYAKELADGSWVNLTPTGKPSELTKGQWVQVRTDNFKKWFGDWENDPDNASKVVNPKTGEPLVVYHGTNQNITAFDPARIGLRDAGFFGSGFYSTPDEGFAQDYADTAVEDTGEGEAAAMPLYVSLQNPFIWDMSDEGADATRAALAAAGIKRTSVRGNSAALGNAKERKIFNRAVREQGYDGVIVRDEDGIQEVVAFRPEQIKSATSNVGTFNNANNDIRFSRPVELDEITDFSKTGKVKNEDTLFGSKTLGSIKAKDWAGFEENFLSNRDKIQEALEDNLVPVKRWIKKMPISNNMKQSIVGALYRAPNVRNVILDEIDSSFITPMSELIAKLSKKYEKLSPQEIKRIAGYWMDTVYAPTANANLIAKDRAAYNEAVAGGDAGEIAAADRKLRERIAEVNDTDLGRRKFKHGVAGGYTNAQAAQIRKNFEALMDVKDLQEIASHVYGMLKYKLDLDLKSGKITQDQYNEWSKNKNYVPLTGEPQSDIDDVSDLLVGGSLNVQKDKAMGGRTSSIAEDAIDAATRAVNKSAVFAGYKDFKDGINAVYEDALNEKINSGLDAKESMKEIAQEYGLERSGLMGTTRTSDNVIIHKVNGKDVQFNVPTAVMEAIKGMNVEFAASIFKYPKMLNQWFGRALTQFYPMFAPKNLIMDVGERSEVIRVKDIYDAKGNKVDGNKVANSMLRKSFNPSTIKNIAKEIISGKLDSQDAKDLKELMDLGGASTFVKSLRDEKSLIDKINSHRNIAKNTKKKLLEVTEKYNDIFSYVPMLAAYQSFKENGVSPKDAASLTLDLTNFGKRGKWMSPVSALFVFAQPTALGAANLSRVLSTRRGQTRAAVYVAIGMALYMMLRALDDEDEGGNKLDQQGDITRHILIPSPINKGEYIKIPLGYGLPQWAWNISVNVSRSLVGAQSGVDAISNIAVNNAKSFAPIAPSEIPVSKYPIEKLVMTLSPTLFQPFVQIALNKNAFGTAIKPAFARDDKLKSEQSKSTTAEEWKDAAIWLQRNTGVDMHPEQIKNLYDGYKGFLGPMRDLSTFLIENPNKEAQGKTTSNPILNSFYGSENAYAIQSRYYEAMDEAKQLKAELDSRKKQGDLGDWLTDDVKKKLAWYEQANKEEGKASAVKSKATKSNNKGGMSDAVYAGVVNSVAKSRADIQRRQLNKWRILNGQPTILTK